MYVMVWASGQKVTDLLEDAILERHMVQRRLMGEEIAEALGDQDDREDGDAHVRMEQFCDGREQDRARDAVEDDTNDGHRCVHPGEHGRRVMRSMNEQPE